MPACKAILQACQRHLRDLELAARPRSDYYFDAEEAQDAIDFFSLVRHSKGEWAGQPFVLAPWQAFIVAMLFGWKRRSDGMRRFREAYIAVPRKNGKSTTVAGIGLLLLVADGEPGAEVYSFATTKDQAKIVFEEAVRMKKASPALAKRVSDFTNNLSVAATNSKFMPLSAEDGTLDGLNVSGGLGDELHEHPSRALWDVIATATGARRQPLLVGITTAGVDRQSFCFKQHDYAKKILERILEDDTFFAFIAELDEGDDWEDERNWYKANPNLCQSVKIDDLRRKAARAKDDPTSLNSFLRKHLNVWTRSETRAIAPHKWNACRGFQGDSIDPMEVRKLWLEQLTNCECFGGLDLATTTDIAAEVLIFPKTERNAFTRVLPFFFVPQESILARAKRDRVPYDLWSRQGWIIETPGNVIDYHFIRETIREHQKKYQILEFGFDPYNATQLVSELSDDGLNMVEVRQGYLSLSAPTKQLIKMVLGQELAHGANPVLDWMVDNLIVSEDPAGNIKPDKAKAKEKIDGVSALVVAISRMLASPDALGGSTYERNPILVL